MFPVADNSTWAFPVTRVAERGTPVPALRDTEPCEPSRHNQGASGTMETMSTKAGTDLEVLECNHPVIELRRAGLSFRRIAELNQLPKSTCYRRYGEALAALPAFADVELCRADVLADLDILLEILRPLVHDDELVPAKADVANFLKALATKMKLLDLDRVLNVSTDATANIPKERCRTRQTSCWDWQSGPGRTRHQHPGIPASDTAGCHGWRRGGGQRSCRGGGTGHDVAVGVDEPVGRRQRRDRETEEGGDGGPGGSSQKYRPQTRQRGRGVDQQGSSEVGDVGNGAVPPNSGPMAM
jgi:hypothetical protein